MRISSAEMRKAMTYLTRIAFSFIVAITANFYSIHAWCGSAGFLWMFAILFAAINIRPSFSSRKLRTKKLRNCADGCELLTLFLLSTTFSFLYSVAGWIGSLGLASLIADPFLWLFNTLFVFLAEAIVFWNGMIRIYLYSSQLGIKWRVIGALCGFVPIANLIVLTKMIRIVSREVICENEKILQNENRKEEKICQTKYPLLLVHGVFFRDSDYFNYWGRIPKELQANGAAIYYGNHPSAASVEDSAKELDARIRQIVCETKCEKVNIIAHSKGGLDCRYALSALGTDAYVASLTTINTPHRGCEFADFLLKKIPESQKNKIAGAYNATLRKFGEENPDFLAAVYSLTAEQCAQRNEHLPDSPNVYYQSTGSRLSVPSGGRFPLNMTCAPIRYFDGYNDGLVGEKSFAWGDHYEFINPGGTRGVSHGDMIDLNRENFDGFDVREFYVQLVHELKEKGF